jgi:hypothetical protein
MSKLWSKKDVKLETEEMKMAQIVPELITSFKNRVILDLIHETQEGIKRNRIDRFDYPKDADYKQVKV